MKHKMESIIEIDIVQSLKPLTNLTIRFSKSEPNTKTLNGLDPEVLVGSLSLLEKTSSQFTESRGSH